jgi:hypothetical protein
VVLLTRVFPTLRYRLIHCSCHGDEGGFVLSDVERGRGLEWVSHDQTGLPVSRVLHTLTEYQSLRVKGSWVFFLRPFLPFERRLFLLSSQATASMELRLAIIPANFRPRNSIDCGIRERAKKNSLSDSHDCEKLPSRGAVEVERCCRDAGGGGRERFNRILKWFPKCVRLGCASLELSENSFSGVILLSTFVPRNTIPG